MNKRKQNNKKNRQERKIRCTNKKNELMFKKKERCIKKEHCIIFATTFHKDLNFSQSKVGFLFRTTDKNAAALLELGLRIFRSLGSGLVCSLFVLDPPGTLDGWALWTVVHLMACTVSRITAPITSFGP